jgi:hypothetical protein
VLVNSVPLSVPLGLTPKDVRAHTSSPAASAPIIEPCTAKPVTLTAAEAAALLTLLKRVINAWHLQRANYREIFVILDKLGVAANIRSAT